MAERKENESETNAVQKQEREKNWRKKRRMITFLVFEKGTAPTSEIYSALLSRDNLIERDANMGMIH
ncbi:hypothetical protein [Mesobacillus foraminis]|uniref:hypothetical protein n=1 Tax=Mesobacillus foraminis TaxID=279826 RepID=UPI0013CF3036|nr:hypothetical protein [Mesobacillus foraminis]